MDISALGKKLLLHKVQQALVLNAPEGYLEQLGETPAEMVTVIDPGEKYVYVQLFVKERAELDDWIDRVLGAIAYDAYLWVSYPKGGSGVQTDLNRDKIWKALAEKGISPVSMVSIDEVWSAMRLRPTELVDGKQ